MTSNLEFKQILAEKHPTMNPTGLYPKGKAILLKPYEPPKGLIQIPLPAQERAMMVEAEGYVIAIGANAWRDEPEPRAHLGDKVIVSRYTGSIVKSPVDGKLYRMVNAEDIYCVVDKAPGETVWPEMASEAGYGG